MLKTYLYCSLFLVFQTSLFWEITIITELNHSKDRGEREILKRVLLGHSEHKYLTNASHRAVDVTGSLKMPTERSGQHLTCLISSVLFWSLHWIGISFANEKQTQVQHLQRAFKEHPICTHIHDLFSIKLPSFRMDWPLIPGNNCKFSFLRSFWRDYKDPAWEVIQWNTSAIS